MHSLSGDGPWWTCALPVCAVLFYLHSTSVVHAILQYRCCNMLHVEKKKAYSEFVGRGFKTFFGFDLMPLLLVYGEVNRGWLFTLNLQFYSFSCFSSVSVPLLKTPNLLLDHFEESFYCPHHPLSLCILFWLYLFFFFFKTGVKEAAWISVILMWWSFLFLLPYAVINAVFFHNVLNWCFNRNIPSNFSSSSLEACDCVCIYGCIFHVCIMSCWLLFSVFSIAT